jgi:hypothetical protein
MASLFAKAKETGKAVVSTGTTKSTTWAVGDPVGDEVGKAVHELVAINYQEKALAAKKRLFMTTVETYAQRKLVSAIAAAGVLPETPMKVTNAEGDSVTYVLADRSGQYNVKEEQKLVLNELLGADATQELLYEETSFSFNRDVMMKPGVSEAIEKALIKEIARLVKTGLLSEEDQLVDAKVKESFKPGTVARTGIICGSDSEKINSFLEAMGSSCCRFVKT